LIAPYPDDETNQRRSGNTRRYISDRRFTLGPRLDRVSRDPASLREPCGKISGPNRMSGHDLLIPGSLAGRRGHQLTTPAARFGRLDRATRQLSITSHPL
jgi:hypothetical protein